MMLLLRDLSADEPNAIEQLCSLFDAKTSDGSDMNNYDELLKRALASIENTFQRRSAAGLLSSRNAMLPTADQTPAANGSDFDLVTWLVIMEAKS